MKECTSCNPVNTTLKVLGGKWKALILWFLSHRPYRYGELSKEIPGITQKMLTQQLRELEADGLVKRKVYPEVPPRVEYFLTEYGRTATPVLKSMHAWGQKHGSREGVLRAKR